MNHRLTQLKEKSGLTNQQIADKSGVPLSTVTRVFNGQTDNPTYRTIADIVIAMGGSLDSMEGIEHHSQEKTPDKLVDLYERELEHKNRMIRILFYSLLAVASVFILIVLIDVLNGHIGFVRY